MSTRQRYPSDLTDVPWDNIEHLFPPERQPPGRPGRHRTYPRREVVNALCYLARAGWAWRMPPHDFPPWKLVSYYFYTWRDRGPFAEVHRILRVDLRRAAGREDTPSGAIIDSQTVKTTEAGGPKGYDAGKKISGRKRHLLVDTLGLVWGLAVPAADVQDWDGAKEVFRRAGGSLPRLAKVRADSIDRALAGWVAESGRWVPELSGKRPGQTTFEVQKWRWVVERTFGWFGRYRRLSKDDEHNPKSSEAWIDIAMIHRMSRLMLPRRDKDEDLLKRPPKRPKT